MKLSQLGRLRWLTDKVFRASIYVKDSWLLLHERRRFIHLYLRLEQ